MKRETMKWLRSAEAGRMSVREEEVAEDILAELKRLRRIERAAKAVTQASAQWASDETVDFLTRKLRAALKKGGRK